MINFTIYEGIDHSWIELDYYGLTKEVFFDCPADEVDWQQPHDDLLEWLECQIH